MRSTADSLREELRAQTAALPEEERVALALALGRRDLALYAEARGLDLATAREELRARAQIGRRPCSFLPAYKP